MQLTIFDFLSAIGNAVLNSFWQLGVLWLAVISIVKLKKGISTAAVSNLSFLALTTGFSAFIATFIISLGTTQTGNAVLTLLENPLLAERIAHFSALLYLALLIFPLIRFAIDFKNVNDLRLKGLHRPPGHYKIFLLDAANHLGIRKKVRLWISDLVDTPLTIGFLKPVILLPFAVVNNLSTQQVEAIILHELAHIKRHDFLFNLISRFIGAVLYFNPFVKALLKLQNTEREKTADQWVLQFEYSGQMYAATLLRLARENKSAHPQLALQATSKHSPLYTRVQWIMGLKERSTPSLKKILGSIMLILSLAFVSLTLSTTTPKSYSTAAIGNIEFGPAPVFTMVEKNEEVDEFTIRPIPFMDVDNTTEKNTVYLKQFQDPETGEIEIVKPSEVEETTPFVFVSEAKPEIPVLSAEQEKKVQEHLALIKKVVAENNWKQFEIGLAETLTSDQKIQLKKVYMLLMDATDWSRQADQLRLAYDDINWDAAQSKLNTAMAVISADSLRKNYEMALEKYEMLRKQLNENNSSGLNEKFAEAEGILMKADSLRRKKILEL